jgi:hypothetical protein
MPKERWQNKLGKRAQLFFFFKGKKAANIKNI